jgi:hypothetical protein
MEPKFQLLPQVAGKVKFILALSTFRSVQCTKASRTWGIKRPAHCTEAGIEGMYCTCNSSCHEQMAVIYSFIPSLFLSDQSKHFIWCTPKMIHNEGNFYNHIATYGTCCYVNVAEMSGSLSFKEVSKVTTNLIIQKCDLPLQMHLLRFLHIHCIGCQTVTAEDLCLQHKYSYVY